LRVHIIGIRFRFSAKDACAQLSELWGSTKILLSDRKNHSRVDGRQMTLIAPPKLAQYTEWSAVGSNGTHNHVTR